jgi:hypothetical protein
VVYSVLVTKDVGSALFGAEILDMEAEASGTSGISEVAEGVICIADSGADELIIGVWIAVPFPAPG